MLPPLRILAAAMMATLLLAASQPAAGQPQPNNTPGGVTNMPVVEDPKPTGKNAAKYQRVDSRSVIPNEYLVKLTFGSGGAAVTSAADVTAADARIQRMAERPMTSLDFPTGLKIRILQVAARNVKQSIQALVDDPAVEMVAPNAKVNATGDVSSLVDQPISNAYLWGLDRIDQYEPLSQYSYSTAGVGAFVYVVDTGIRATHSDLVGRVEAGASFITGRTPADDNGHGTHCAGTIGGTTYGVAKRVRLVPVKVLDSSGSGSYAGVINGVYWAINHGITTNCRKVISMSLGGGAYQLMDDAVTAANRAGVTVVVAAGNSNANACLYSPARAPAAVTVAASTSTDWRSSFSNYGSCVDIFGPGSNILSSWFTSDTATAILSGTSMATPHVAGLAARLISSFAGCPACPGLANPADCVWSLLRNNANPNVIKDPAGSPNLLAYLHPRR